MTTTVKFVAAVPEDLSAVKVVQIIGSKVTLAAAATPFEIAEYAELVEGLTPGIHGSSEITRASGKRVVLSAIGTKVSRANIPSNPYDVSSLVKKAGFKATSDGLVIAHTDAAGVVPTAIAIARVFSLYSSKTPAKADNTVYVFIPAATDVALLQAVGDAARSAGDLYDRPTCELSTLAFLAEAEAVAAAHESVTIKSIKGEELKEMGYGGIYGVGKAAEEPPILVILSAGDDSATEENTLAMVGKGVTYDTGGLSLKSSVGMSGMKGDMGGAAAVLNGFNALVKTGIPAGKKVHAVLCLVENAINERAQRPDDIVHMASGLTVELNNTDAEGRLILHDGVYHSQQVLKAGVIVDIATLTGAQPLSTGNRMCAVVSNTDAGEALSVAAGRATGEFVAPLPYYPEYLMGEFTSVVADMKNSVKCRSNAQSSCAGLFVAAGLKLEDEGVNTNWIHLDIAGPSCTAERGTGFGSALLWKIANTF